MSVTITKLPKDSIRGVRAWQIMQDGEYVGLITKAPNTTKDIHPYKVFAQTGKGSDVLCAVAFFYADSDAARIGDVFDGEKGGLDAAMAFAHGFRF